MAKKKPSPEHFERDRGEPGWVYVARNDMHREDIYKVGYTTKTPKYRVALLNSNQRNRTSQIGFFTLIYACAALDAYGCEQALFARVGRLREAERKEFVNAPLELISGELLQIQKRDHQKKKATLACHTCGTVISFCPLPQVVHFCPKCGTRFQCTADGRLRVPDPTINRVQSYAASSDAFLPSRRSPLAEAFVRLQARVRKFAIDGELTDDEFMEEMGAWQLYTPPMDRARPVRKPPPAKRKQTNKTTPLPTSRKGWMDCPRCLSSVQVDPDETPKCVECGWPEESLF